MDNKYLWLIGGIIAGYLICKHRTKKEVISKVDVAIDTLTKEIHENFNQALDLAKQKELTLDDVKQIINTNA